MPERGALAAGAELPLRKNWTLPVGTTVVLKPEFTTVVRRVSDAPTKKKGVAAAAEVFVEPSRRGLRLRGVLDPLQAEGMLRPPSINIAIGSVRHELRE